MDCRVSLGYGRFFLVYAPPFPQPFSKTGFFPLADRVGASRMDAYEAAALLDRECFFSGPRFFSRGRCEAQPCSRFFQGSAAIFFRAGAGRNWFCRFRNNVGPRSRDLGKASGDTSVQTAGRHAVFDGRRCFFVEKPTVPSAEIECIF